MLDLFCFGVITTAASTRVCRPVSAPCFQTFHASRWADEVHEKEGSAAHGIDQASHWVTRDQPDAVNRRLDEFLADL